MKALRMNRRKNRRGLRLIDAQIIAARETATNEFLSRQMIFHFCGGPSVSGKTRYFYGNFALISLGHASCKSLDQLADEAMKPGFS
jgi:hypothetical protein